VNRVRAGLVALLGWLDDEPEWADFLLVQAPQLATLGARSQQQLSELLEGLIDPPAGGLSDRDVSSLTTELVANGLHAVLLAQMAEGERKARLVELAPSLVAFVVGPHLEQGDASVPLVPVLVRGDKQSGFDKRPLAATEVVFMPATGVRLTVGRKAHGRASSQTDGVGGSPEGGPHALFARKSRG